MNVAFVLLRSFKSPFDFQHSHEIIKFSDLVAIILCFNFFGIMLKKKKKEIRKRFVLPIHHERQTMLATIR